MGVDIFLGKSIPCLSLFIPQIFKYLFCARHCTWHRRYDCEQDGLRPFLVPWCLWTWEAVNHQTDKWYIGKLKYYDILENETAKRHPATYAYSFQYSISIEPEEVPGPETTHKHNIHITEVVEQEILALLSSTNIWPIFKWWFIIPVQLAFIILNIRAH